MKSVLLIQRRLPQYRTGLFERLKERLSETNIALSLVVGGPSPSEALKNDEASLEWATKVRARYVSIGATKPVVMSLPEGLVKGQDLIIMPHENSMMLNYYLLARHYAFPIPKIAFFGHGKNFQAAGSGRFREVLKRSVIPLVDWWFAYTDLSVKEVRAAGFEAGKITCLNNAIDTPAQRKMAEQVTGKEKEDLLKDLGLKGKVCAVFLGGLHMHKRLGFLFQAADELRKRIPGFELVLIGDGPEGEMVRKLVEKRPWARLIGARFGREKVLYASLGTVMLNPGLVGLGILDSFSLGIPLVTTDCGIHSPEIAYLESGRNGIMTEDRLDAFVSAAEGLFTDQGKLDALRKQCIEDSGKYTLDAMIENFANGIEAALGLKEERNVAGRKHLRGGRIAVIWQRFLPYHKARLMRLRVALAERGYEFFAIEVASQDISYGFPEGRKEEDNHWITCLPGEVYHRFSADVIREKVLRTLRECRPDLVFAPATAFPEGMAALKYRTESGCRVMIMDDAWEMSDTRGPVTRMAKRVIHTLADGALIPAPSHMRYYADLNIPEDRMVFGLDVVDNDYFAAGVESLRRNKDGHGMNLPQSYFLFIGRFLKRKGIETLLDAYKAYRDGTRNGCWDLVLVGEGPEVEAMKKRALGIRGVHFAGRRVGDDLLACYAYAKALIVPSGRDPWALVVNEGMASGLPVIVSKGCGAAQTLVHEGENGWTFSAGNARELAEIMYRMSNLSPQDRDKMSAKSREIVSEWSLDRFVEGVLSAVVIPRREPGSIFADLAVRLWKGRVSVN